MTPRAILLSAGLCVTAIAANAASAPPPAAIRGPDPTEMLNFGAWTVRCFPVQSGAPCDMAQESSNQQTKQRLVLVSLAYVPAQNRYAATIVTPLGVQLPAGLIIASGDYKSPALTFRRCEDDGCYVEAAIDNAIMEKLSQGGKSVLNVTMFGGGGIALPLSLDGFVPALNTMRRLTAEKLAPPSASPATAAPARRR